jgi:DNA processing protein
LKLKPVIGVQSVKPPADLNMFEAKIFEVINNEPKHIDTISQMSNLSSSDSLVHLLSLEFRGLIKQLPGKMFIRF